MTFATDWLAGYPPSTATAYAHALDELARSCGSPPERATQADVLAYQAQIGEQASATVARKLSSLSSFFLYLQRRGARADNPIVAVRVERYRPDPMRTVRYLTIEEIGRLMGAATDDRDRAILTVGLHGLRLGEIVALNVEQYREAALMGIQGKGGRIRNVPLASGALPIIERYIGRRKSGPLFLSRSRRRIQRRQMQNIVYRVSERAGKRISIHQLRHTAGTTLLRAGANLAAVQDVLGHSSPATTRVYARLELSDLRAAVEAAPILGDDGLRVIEDERPGPVQSLTRKHAAPARAESTPTMIGRARP